MNLSLQELGYEYDKSIEIQKEIISETREKLHRAKKAGNFKEIKRLNTLLCVLYEEKSELEEKAHRLKNYYKS